ncbi:hypothetical protein [Oerskovia flava]|uniref:hypothetical protein n=1 Tax=Oerskovia flava TaxID=2986422 RepID=UPI00223EAF7A|nr:hypothetical protein [Oerskovia sp. JB1-3-2]
MKKRLVSALLGVGLGIGMAIAPVGVANAAPGISCPAGRVVSFTSAKPFSVRVYVTSNPGTVYTATKMGSVYKVITGRQSIAEWHVVSSQAPVTGGCTV